MWYPATVTTPPASEPVSLADAKAQCGVTDGASDALLKRLVSSERAFVEKYCGIKVMTQTMTVKCDDFSSFDRVPVAPIQSISAITYLDGTGSPQTLDPSIYELRADGMDASIALQFGRSWPSIQRGSRVSVMLVAGFAAPEADLLSAIFLRIGNGYLVSTKDPTLRLQDIPGVIRRDWDNSGAMAQSFKQAVCDLLENYRCWTAL